ncbi:phosphoribosylanthranilate isomerase [Endozoicomonas montiporae]|uniref:N-(5'-phosphoribosyl)anthranilate isomerase n=1 Tax=Endozoicomonas montiporae CL-33 TaxID=570277 RepID=A0A142BDM6_9GAMM|nr:phosphoribosylanthranilate isomerase [Endozoicomonas montiporae]AMO56852.1 N-(5'-phosphoribosyl)anthranilate isomerase [Endozoicomonas montiporae CL-33]
MSLTSSMNLASTVHKTRIKVCGITTVEDALAAVDAGADAIGLVFYAKSPRHVSIEQAREIAACVPPFISVVGLFVDADDDFVQSVLEQVPLTLLQFHGNEPDHWCQQWNRQYIKALRVRPEMSLEKAVAQYPGASGVLLDAYRKGVPGGTGESFDWRLIPDSLEKPVVLAGGLEATNVAEAIKRVSPYAVDVSSGVETKPGVKNHDAVRAFVRAVVSENGLISAQQTQLQAQ